MDLYLKQYLASVKATRATNTYTTYCNAFKNWFSDGKVNLELDFINNKLQQWDCSVNTKALRCRILKKFIDFLSNYITIDGLPVILQVLQSVDTKTIVPAVVSKEQYHHILYHCIHLRSKIAVSLMFQNGLRAEEVLSIKTTNYNTDEKSILLVDTKNHNDYKVYITDGLASMIEEYIDYNSTYLLHTRNNTQIGYVAFYREIKNICIKAGYPELHCHSFRHGSAVTLLDNNINLFVIKEHLRHKSIQSTQRYLHISQQHREQVRDIFSAI